ncbi:glycoprotein-N-acetylgalactosamine 3-beta-galactosyltransferase 1-like [Gigantopelta aegis]|uniref:glycoprotein-N-acetylgalactosamine 3-beta-galactosyltransferase 1-like n=1 Tax=Gigantopelta aegis TaxID=1735272 RepID=UPI001B88CDC7|nr:glycoprotein-N-acetylgalactosamine 3-beta-galactosyltransferase 1-like [Gigantopelta aegis]
MAAARFMDTMSAVRVVFGVCFGITVTVLVIESGCFVCVDLYHVGDVGWRDQIRRYVAQNTWAEDNETQARRIGDRVKLTCVVILPAKQFTETYATIQQTWTKRCDNVLYFSNVLPLEDNVVKVDNPENIELEYSASVLFNVLNYVYRYHKTNTDWVLKVVPQTYIIVENLKLFLSDKNPKEPIYYGQKFSQLGLTFPCAYAGYVISREALRRLATEGSKEAKCRTGRNEEDVFAIARCLKTLGVAFGDSLDSRNRSRFNSVAVEHVATHVFDDWYLAIDINANVTILGVSSISPSAISLGPYGLNNLMALEYYFYHVRRYGVVPRGIA